jgi:hypothetical protein
MEGSKIHLSATELDLVNNAELILTKNAIIKKTVALFETIQDVILEQHKTNSNKFYSVLPKISKGENYLGLPYVVLDYPRISHNNNLCFIRTMFWWGHFFSSTLQLSGIYKEQHINHIASSYNQFCTNNYFIGINTDPWQHHFEETNYRTIASFSAKEFETVLHEQPHIKIAAKWSLKEWNLAATSLLKSWKFLAGLIA